MLVFAADPSASIEQSKKGIEPSKKGTAPPRAGGQRGASARVSPQRFVSDRRNVPGRNVGIPGPVYAFHLRVRREEGGLCGYTSLLSD